MVYTRAQKPALRGDGQMRYDFTVTHVAGLDDIAYAIVSEFANNDSELSKKKIFDAIAHKRSISGVLNDGDWDDVSNEEIDRAYALAADWFPELVVKKEEVKE